MRATSMEMRHGRHDRISGNREEVALPLACGWWRGSQGELVVQRNLRGVKWWRLATAQAVTGLNATATGKAPKLELDVT